MAAVWDQYPHMLECETPRTPSKKGPEVSRAFLCGAKVSELPWGLFLLYPNMDFIIVDPCLAGSRSNKAFYSKLLVIADAWLSCSLNFV